MGCIYLVTNLCNKKRYVGKTMLDLEKRKYQHIQHARLNTSNGLLHKAIRKYGIKSFEWIELYSSLDESELSLMEIILIKQLDLATHVGYNLTCGGEGKSGRLISDDHRRRIQILNQGKTKGKSGFTGVSQISNAKKNKWRAMITKNQKTISLGCFPTAEEAAKVYNDKAIELYGKEAKLNILAQSS